MSKEKVCSIILVLDSPLPAEEVVIVTCLRVFLLLLVFVECWLLTQGLKAAAVVSEVKRLS